jgi:type IV pilus biogenesis protein CpaD/CtpE
MYSRVARLLVAALAVSIPVSQTACVKRPSTGQPAPAEYRTAQAVAVLVEANKTATEVAISLNRASVLDRGTTAEILNYTEAVARSAKAVLAVLDDGRPLEEKRAEIRAALAALSNAGLLRKGGLPPAVVTALTTVQLLVEETLREVGP